jgi:putative nucleotidyltransferase with HDIG domain
VAILAALSRAIEARDPYTCGHSTRVARLAEALARRLSWHEDRLAALRIGGRLHDVGKLAVADSILLKPGRLEPGELAQIREHPTVGARLIRRFAFAREVLPYVLYHHERWDGCGYPTGKAGKEIPIEARVLALADAFDAMTSVRPYRNALAPEQALEEVVRCAGTQFDPMLALAFVDVWSTGVVGAARTATGRRVGPRASPRPRASVASGG